MRKHFWGKMVSVVVAAALAVSTCLSPFATSDAAVTLSKNLKRVSVHDPSIFKDNGTYYVFGSHMATGSSTDLKNWTQVSRDYQSTSNNSVYGNIDTNFAEPFQWAGKNDSDCKGGYAIWAPDVIYNPQETRLLRAAIEAGCKTGNGMYMLLYQGAASFKLWTGEDMPVEIIKEKYFSGK